MSNNLASTPPPREGCESLLAAVHHALGCPQPELPGVVAVCRAALAVALDGPEPSYPELVSIVEHTGSAQ